MRQLRSIRRSLSVDAMRTYSSGMWPSPEEYPAAQRRPKMTLHTFKRQLERAICSTYDKSTNKSNLHHLRRCCGIFSFWCHIQTPSLLTYAVHGISGRQTVEHQNGVEALQCTNIEIRRYRKFNSLASPELVILLQY